MPILFATLEILIAMSAAYLAPVFFKAVIDLNENWGTSLIRYPRWRSLFRGAAWCALYSWPVFTLLALLRLDWGATIAIFISYPLLARRFRVVADRFPNDNEFRGPQSA